MWEAEAEAEVERDGSDITVYELACVLSPERS